MLPAQRARLQDVADYLAGEIVQRRRASSRAIADLLVRLTALRRPIEEEVYTDPARRRQAEQEFQQLSLGFVRACADTLLQIHGFRGDDVALTQLPWQDGRWANDLFHPETLREAGKRLGMGAAVGAGIGLVADAAVGGLSLGAGAALGGAIGSVISQGWRQVGGKLMNQIMGVRELTLDNALLFLVALQLLSLARALEQRGHAALDTLVQGLEPDPALDAPLKRVVQAVQSARSHAEWERASSTSTRRQRLVDEVAALLEPLAAPPPPT